MLQSGRDGGGGGAGGGATSHSGQPMQLPVSHAHLVAHVCALLKHQPSQLGGGGGGAGGGDGDGGGGDGDGGGDGEGGGGDGEGGGGEGCGGGGEGCGGDGGVGGTGGGETSHSAQPEHWSEVQAHLVAQVWALVLHQFSQADAVVLERRASRAPRSMVGRNDMMARLSL